jgi:hypothetical protein
MLTGNAAARAQERRADRDQDESAAAQAQRRWWPSNRSPWRI